MMQVKYCKRQNITGILPFTTEDIKKTTSHSLSQKSPAVSKQSEATSETSPTQETPEPTSKKSSSKISEQINLTSKRFPGETFDVIIN